MIKKLPDRIFIYGFMGAGKTTVGKTLAQKTDQPFYDLDACIEEESGKMISSIFEDDGEQAFRQKEKAALLHIIRTQKGVIALGGGSLHNQHLTNHVKEHGLLIFIETPMDTLIDRIMKHKHRPLLMDKNGNMKSKAELKEELVILYEKRLPFYEQAEIKIQSSRYHSVQTLTDQLIKKIKNHVARH